jgi:hypothetical protein
VLQQQARFDDFLTRYNTDRPHQAIGMKVPADLYARSPRVYRGLEELMRRIARRWRRWRSGCLLNWTQMVPNRRSGRKVKQR